MFFLPSTIAQGKLTWVFFFSSPPLMSTRTSVCFDRTRNKASKNGGKQLDDRISGKRLQKSRSSWRKSTENIANLNDLPTVIFI